ncbi:MAG: hypothetical protein ACK56I_31350, partial [bacterium]
SHRCLDRYADTIHGKVNNAADALQQVHTKRLPAASVPRNLDDAHRLAVLRTPSALDGALQ